MEKNHKKGQNRKSFHLKKHRKSDDNRSFNPRSPIQEDTDNEKPVLFQLGSIAYGVNNDVRLKPDPEITTSRSSTSLSLSSTSQTSSENILEETIANERKSSSSFNSSQHNKEILSLSSSLCDDLRGSLETSVSASVEPALLSPSVQMMEREGYEQQQQTNSLPNLEKNLSLISNDSLFSLSIGDNVIDRDDFFSYRDFKTGEVLVSGELLKFCPSIHVPLDSFDEGNSSDLEEEESVETELPWRNLEDMEDCDISDEAPSSTQSFSYPITKKKKKKKKGKKKKAIQQSIQQQQSQPQPQPQQQPQKQKQKKRCSWLCCKSTEPCLSCCKRLKCCSCCCSSCSWLFCCPCCSSSKKVLDDEITRSSEEQKLQKSNHKWFCC